MGCIIVNCRKLVATPIPKIENPEWDISLSTKVWIKNWSLRIFHDCADDCLVSYSSRQFQTFKQWHDNKSKFCSHELEFSELNPNYTRTSKGLRSTLYLTEFVERVSHKIYRKSAPSSPWTLRKNHTGVIILNIHGHKLFFEKKSFKKISPTAQATVPNSFCKNSNDYFWRH